MRMLYKMGTSIPIFTLHQLVTGVIVRQDTVADNNMC